MRISGPILLCSFLVLATGGQSAGQNLRFVESDAKTGISAAVIVDDVPLLHTAQLLPVDAEGRLAGADSPAAQLDVLIHRLDAILAAAGAERASLVKLNLYVASDETGRLVVGELPRHFRREARPALSVVTTPLTLAGAEVALDAVAALPGQTEASRRSSLAAILPAGGRIFISGQAEPAETLREATRKTLESLSATLKHLDRSDDDVVQVKCFLNPMAQAAEVQEELARYYGSRDSAIPLPAVFVEWKSTAPIEIELVAAGVAADDGAAEPLVYATPPGMTASPLFSRVARVQRGGTIYLGDMFGPAGVSPGEEMSAAFDRLKLLLEKTGSDLKHLVKATYYVTDNEISQAHNELRPKVYDPARPPAASKALVVGTGRQNVRYSMDMIAIPSSGGTPTSPPANGFGLSEKESADGWISLFDGETTFGWRDGQIDDEGLLVAGRTPCPFPKFEMVAAGASQGDLQRAGKSIARFSAAGTIRAEIDGPPGEIALGAGLRLKSLIIRPLGLERLWNRTDLAAWQPIARAGQVATAEPHFRIEGGRLRVSGGPAALEYTPRQFDDFVLQIDVRTRAVHSNGGVFFRAIPGQFMNGYEAQLHNRCLNGDPLRPFRYATGGLDDRQDARRLVSRDFHPFRMAVVAHGPRIATWVNGYQTTDWTDDRPVHDNPRQGRRETAGVLQIQAHDPATDYEVLDILAAPIRPTGEGN